MTITIRVTRARTLLAAGVFVALVSAGAPISARPTAATRKTYTCTASLQLSSELGHDTMLFKPAGGVDKGFLVSGVQGKSSLNFGRPEKPQLSGTYTLPSKPLESTGDFAITFSGEACR
jgi:hypothetical protein